MNTGVLVQRKFAPIISRRGELVDGLEQMQQRAGPIFIDAFHPRVNCGRRDVEGIGCLFEGPAPRGTKLEDCQAQTRDSI